MDGVLEILADNPFLAAAAALLVVFAVVSIAKKLIKLAMVLMVAFAAIVAYFAWVGQRPPDPLRKLERTIGDGVEEGADKAKELLGR